MSQKKEIGDIEIHAFIDGALDADRLPEIKARIEADPALAQRTAEFRADKEMLKRVYAPLLDRPIPQEWLALVHVPTVPSWTAMSRRLVGSIAAVFLIAVGTFGYWELRPINRGEIVQTALDARANVAQAERVVSIRPGANADEYDGILSAAVALNVKVPDLARLGYQLAEIRLYRDSTNSGAAELFYVDTNKQLFTLYLRHSDGTVRFDQFNRDGLRVCVWQDEELGTVMAGNVSTAAMQRLASLAYTGLTL